MRRAVPFLALLPVLFPVLLGLLLPEPATPLLLSLDDAVSPPRLRIEGPPGVAFGVVTGEKVGPFLAAPASRKFLMIHPDDVERARGTPAYEGMIPTSGNILLDGAALGLKPGSTILQAAGVLAGGDGDQILTSNALVVDMTPAGTVTFRGLRSFVWRGNRRALATLVASVLIAALAFALLPRRWFGARWSAIAAPIACVAAVLGVVRAMETLPSPGRFLAAEDSKYAASFGPSFLDLGARLRGYEADGRRVLAVLDQVSSSHALYAARFSTPRLLLDEVRRLPEDVTPYGAILAFLPIEPPPGFEPVLRSSSCTVYARGAK